MIKAANHSPATARASCLHPASPLFFFVFVTPAHTNARTQPQQCPQLAWYTQPTRGARCAIAPFAAWQSVSEPTPPFAAAARARNLTAPPPHAVPSHAVSCGVLVLVRVRAFWCATASSASQSAALFRQDSLDNRRGGGPRVLRKRTEATTSPTSPALRPLPPTLLSRLPPNTLKKRATGSSAPRMIFGPPLTRALVPPLSEGRHRTSSRRRRFLSLVTCGNCSELYFARCQPACLAAARLHRDYRLNGPLPPIPLHSQR